MPRTFRRHLHPLALPPLEVNTLSANLGILAIGEGNPDVIVPNGIEYTYKGK